MFVIAATTEEEMLNLMRKAFGTLVGEFGTKLDPKENKDELLTVNEAAKFLKVTNATLHNWRKQGLITCLRKGGRVYFSKENLLNSIKSTSKRK